MGGTGVIDNFLGVFTSYIDSGFGLLGGEVAFIATTLIVIDVTLAALFWSWGADDDIIASLVKKTLFAGVFAYLIGNWNSLAQIIFDSFAGLGLKGSGTSFSAADLLRPGKVAQTGLDAGRPLLESISDMMGYWSFFENFIQIACLMFAWVLVLLAFFTLAVQLFVTLIEFKLTTLAGFVLIPFGLFGKTAFMAERVLGNVVSSGIKVLVLAVIIGIGSTLFSQFTAGFGGVTPTIDDAMAIVLAALSLLGLGIFGPGIASGLVSGGPQLGAGAAVGTGLAAGGMMVAGGAAAGMAAKGEQQRSLVERLPFGVVLPPRVRRAPPTVSVHLASPALPVSPPVSAVSRVRQAPPPYHPSNARLPKPPKASSPAFPMERVLGWASPAAHPPRARSEAPARPRALLLHPPHRLAALRHGQSKCSANRHSATARRWPPMPCAPATVMAAAPPSIFLKVTAHEHLQTSICPLRQIPRTRDALSESCPGMGRAYRFSSRAGKELAHHGLRLADPLGRFRLGPGLAIGAWDGRALGGAGR